MQIKDINWSWKQFEDLTLRELYEILKLRIEVFSVEQQCPYQDLDDLDMCSHHLMGLDKENKLVAYLRLISPGFKYKEPSIARVISSRKANCRGIGLGKVLVQEGIKRSNKLYPGAGNRISAQERLTGFYEALNFKVSGFTYLEDNIAHIEMVLSDE